MPFCELKRPFISQDVLHGPVLPNAGAVGLLPAQGTKIPHASWHSQEVSKKIKKSNSPGLMQSFHQGTQ